MSLLFGPTGPWLRVLTGRKPAVATRPQKWGIAFGKRSGSVPRWFIGVTRVE